MCFALFVSHPVNLLYRSVREKGVHFFLMKCSLFCFSLTFICFTLFFLFSSSLSFLSSSFQSPFRTSSSFVFSSPIFFSSRSQLKTENHVLDIFAAGVGETGYGKKRRRNKMFKLNFVKFASLKLKHE